MPLDNGFLILEKGRSEERPSISTGAAYRIRTYDVLIRSQTLYPAEVTPQRANYNGILPRVRQEIFLKKLSPA